jgi:hypothetical protein
MRGVVLNIGSCPVLYIRRKGERYTTVLTEQIEGEGVRRDVSHY